MRRRGIAIAAVAGALGMAGAGMVLLRRQADRPDEDLRLLLRYGRASTRFDEGERVRYQVEFQPKTPMLDRELRASLLRLGWSAYSPPSASWVSARPHWTGSYATMLSAPDGRGMILSQYSTGNGYAILTVNAPWPHRAMGWIKSVLHLR